MRSMPGSAMASSVDLESRRIHHGCRRVWFSSAVPEPHRSVTFGFSTTRFLFAWARSLTAHTSCIPRFSSSLSGSTTESVPFTTSRPCTSPASTSSPSCFTSLLINLRSCSGGASVEKEKDRAKPSRSRGSALAHRTNACFAISTISSAIASDAVAAGLGAFGTGALPLAARIGSPAPFCHWSFATARLRLRHEAVAELASAS